MSTGRVFTLLVLLMEAFGLGAIILVVLLTSKYSGGYAWNGSDKQLNLHPVMMVIGFVFFYGNSIILYRVGAGTNITKFKLKLAHFILHLAAFILSVIGLMAVFQYHNKNGYPNVKSLHSWMGLGTTIFFGLQLLFGFVFFLYPRPREEVRIAYKSVHVFFGIFILAMVVVTVMTGLTEYILFGAGFTEFSAIVLVTNCLAVSIVAFTGLATYIVTNPSFAFTERVSYDQINT